MINRALVFYVVLTTGCTANERPGDKQDLTPPSLNNGTQQDLVREIDEANARRTWSELRHRWQGQWLRWTVIRHAALCLRADACNVAAFPIQRPAKVGWMPQLVFAPGQFARLAEQCGDREQCEVTIEGLLERLEVSGEMPTSLRFGNVKVVTRTAAK
jgi:hypothetical protein